jgi:lysophospholipase L1-like esterase
VYRPVLPPAYLILSVALGRPASRRAAGRGGTLVCARMSSGVADHSISALCPATANPLAVTRVACLGDSLTRGDGAHERRPPREKRFQQRGNYPALLQDLLGPGYVVRNFGHGGAAACNVSDVPYAATRAYAAARRWRADVVVLMLGTNDAKAMHWEGAACGGGGAYREGLRQLLRGLGVGEEPVPNRRGPAVLLLQPPPILRERWGIARRLLRSVRRELGAFMPSPAAARLSQEGTCARGRAYLMLVALSKPMKPAGFSRRPGPWGQGGLKRLIERRAAWGMR